MPKRARELGALELGRLQDDGLHAVGGVPGLHLQINGPAKSWILRATVGVKRRDIGLGGFPAVTLAQARDKARQARESILEGQDPILLRQRAASALRASQASALTFSEAARLFLDAKSDEWRSPIHRRQWVNTLETHAAPHIGKLLVSDIRQEHVLSVLQPIWKIKTETASRLRGRIEQVLDWATVRGYRQGDNPARWKGHLSMLLPKPGLIATVEHHEALPFDDVPAFIANLRQRAGNGARALELLILTAVRSGEVRGATWNEMDIDAATWTIPASRMKAQKEHRVPLSRPALQLLNSLPRIEGCDLVFPGNSNKALSDMTLTAIMRRMNAAGVPHGFRSSFRDWAAERTNFPSQVAEMALAHIIGNKVEAAYRRGELLNKRVLMMTAWATFCEKTQTTTASVLPMKKRLLA